MYRELKESEKDGKGVDSGSPNLLRMNTNCEIYVIFSSLPKLFILLKILGTSGVFSKYSFALATRLVE